MKILSFLNRLYTAIARILRSKNRLQKAIVTNVDWEIVQFDFNVDWFQRNSADDLPKQNE